jgi:hypothetical protein
MAIAIPATEFVNLAKIVSYDKDFFGALIKALNETKPSLTRGDYLTDLVSRLPGASEQAISPVLNTLYSLYNIKNHNDFSAEELAGHVKETVGESEEHREIFAGDKGEILKQRLTALLSYDNSLAVTAKALTVMREHQRVLCHARILTDIRPIFANNPENPLAAMIVHNLQIGFKNSEGKGHQEFYFGLDDDDLDLLAATINRAQQKSKALKSMLSSSKLTCLE